MKSINKNPIDIVKYILYKCTFFGDYITNLKMHKILYYIYVWHLVKFKERCFEERFEAWPCGPVLPKVYHELKQFGSSPIDLNFAKIKNDKDFKKLTNNLDNEFCKSINETYNKYGGLTAFELVRFTHNEMPWQKARAGLDDFEKTDKTISDDDILAYYEQ